MALAASLALVFGETLRPAGGPNRVALAPWTTQQLDAVNAVGNVALFALPSAVLWSFGWSLRRTVVAGFVLSLGIELLQLAIPGWTTATVDVPCNTSVRPPAGCSPASLALGQGHSGTLAQASVTVGWRRSPGQDFP